MNMIGHHDVAANRDIEFNGTLGVRAKRSVGVVQVRDLAAVQGSDRNEE